METKAEFRSFESGGTTAVISEGTGAVPREKREFSYLGLVCWLMLGICWLGNLGSFGTASAQSKAGGLKMMRAIERGETQKVKELMDEGVVPHTKAAMTAAKGGSRDIIELFIPEIESGRIRGHKVLESAVAGGREEIVDLLLTTGVVKLDEKGKKVNRLFSSAVYRKHLAMSRALLRYGAKPFPKHLATATKNGDAPMIEFLVEQGVDVNAVARGEDGPPIYLATAKGYLKTVELLGKLGADPNVDGKDGAPIVVAAERGSSEQVDLLRKLGASDPELRAEAALAEQQREMEAEEERKEIQRAENREKSRQFQRQRHAIQLDELGIKALAPTGFENFGGDAAENNLAMLSNGKVAYGNRRRDAHAFDVRIFVDPVPREGLLKPGFMDLDLLRQGRGASIWEHEWQGLALAAVRVERKREEGDLVFYFMDMPLAPQPVRLTVRGPLSTEDQVEEAFEELIGGFEATTNWPPGTRVDGLDEDAEDLLAAGEITASGRLEMDSPWKLVGPLIAILFCGVVAWIAWRRRNKPTMYIGGRV